MTQVTITRRKPSAQRHLAKFDLSETNVMTMSVAEAKTIQARFHDGAAYRPLISDPDANVKLEKSISDDVLAYGLFLLPADLSGYEMCPARSAGCTRACLNLAGQAGMAIAQDGRAWKTKFLLEAPVAFMRLLVHELDALIRKASRVAEVISFRPNGTSDLRFETLVPWIIERVVNHGIRVYDYTKIRGREATAAALGYDLSFSVQEKTSDKSIAQAARPVVVVNVKRGEALPTTYKGRRVIDGDKSDARFLDPSDKSAVVLLRYKRIPGLTMANAVASGFVRVV